MAHSLRTKGFVLDHAPVPATVPMATRLEANSAYFDAMLSLVPAKYYLREDDTEDEEAGDVKYHRNKGGNAPKQHIKESSKKGKKQLRYAVDAPKTIAEQQEAMSTSTQRKGDGFPGTKRKRAADDSDADAASDEEGGSFGYPAALPRPGAPAHSLEELRARLAARIDVLVRVREGSKASRGGAAGGAAADGEDGDGDGAVVYKKRERQKKRRKGAVAGVATAAAGASEARTGSAERKPGKGSAAAGQPQQQPKQQQSTKAKPTPASRAAEAAAVSDSALDFAFGTIAAAAATSGAAPVPLTKLGNGEEGAKGSKKGKLKHLLKKAQSKQQRLDRLSAAGQPAAKLNASFTSALKRAEGEKPMDDPHLIAKALKRLQKSKAKSGAAWSERKEKEQTDSAARQAVRNENLAKKKKRGTGEKSAKKEAKAAAQQHGIPPASTSHPAQGGANGSAAPTAASSAKGGGDYKGGAPRGGGEKRQRPGFEGGRKTFLNATT